MADLLVAVPDPVRLGSVAQTLRRAGHEVHEAEYPGGIVSRLRSRVHDLLVVAASLLDGMGATLPAEVGAALRSGRLGGVVVLEAWDDLRDIFLAQRVGARGVIPIAATDETLVLMVARALAQHVPSGFLAADGSRIEWAWQVRPLGASGGDVVRAVIAPSGERICVVVMDLTGHGPGVGWACRAVEEALDLDPVEALRRVEETLEVECTTRECRLPRATALAACITPGEIRYLSRGHSPGAVVLATGEVRLLPATAPPLGIASPRIREISVPFPPGAAVLLPTDGLVEAGSTGDGSGEYVRAETAVEEMARSMRRALDETVVPAGGPGLEGRPGFGGRAGLGGRSGPAHAVRTLLAEAERRGLRDDASLFVARSIRNLPPAFASIGS